MRQELKIEHCKQVMDREILIGCDKAQSDGEKVKFTFNIWMNEYSVWHGEEKIESGQAVEGLLQTYNEL